MYRHIHPLCLYSITLFAQTAGAIKPCGIELVPIKRSLASARLPQTGPGSGWIPSAVECSRYCTVYRVIPLLQSVVCREHGCS